MLAYLVPSSDPHSPTWDFPELAPGETHRCAGQEGGSIPLGLGEGNAPLSLAESRSWFVSRADCSFQRSCWL